jgi:hypothetical protein
MIKKQSGEDGVCTQHFGQTEKVAETLIIAIRVFD